MCDSEFVEHVGISSRNVRYHHARTHDLGHDVIEDSSLGKLLIATSAAESYLIARRLNAFKNGLFCLGKGRENEGVSMIELNFTRV